MSEEKINDLNMHCDSCPDKIFELCNRFCSFEEEKTALCCQPRFENMEIKNIKMIQEILEGKECNKYE